MSYILKVFLLYIYMVLVASAQNTPEDGEYGNHSSRKALCEKNDKEMYEELDECFKMEHINVRKVTEECSKEAHPASEGNVVSFYIAACKDTAIFRKFDDCFGEYETNSTFKEQMENTPEVVACYDEVMEKYKFNQ